MIRRRRPADEPIRALLLDDTVREIFGGERVPSVHVFGQTIDIWIEARVSEVARRTAANVGAMPDEEIIRALMCIPQGMPMQPQALDGRLLLAMDQLLEVHAVEFREGLLYRLAAPPVEIVGVSKVINAWSDIRGLTLLSTHGPRLSIAARPIARRIMREIDPEIGVMMASGDGLGLLRTPQANHIRPSWQRWIIAEEAFAAWLSMGGGVP